MESLAVVAVNRPQTPLPSAELRVNRFVSVLHAIELSLSLSLSLSRERALSLGARRCLAAWLYIFWCYWELHLLARVCLCKKDEGRRMPAVCAADAVEHAYTCMLHSQIETRISGVVLDSFYVPLFCHGLMETCMCDTRTRAHTHTHACTHRTHTRMVQACASHAHTRPFMLTRTHAHCAQTRIVHKDTHTHTHTHGRRSGARSERVALAVGGKCHSECADDTGAFHARVRGQGIS